MGRLSSSEASVLLATEPMWAALFAAGLIGESLGPWDAAGGALIVAACAANGADEAWAREILRLDDPAAEVEEASEAKAGELLAAAAEDQVDALKRIAFG